MLHTFLDQLFTSGEIVFKRAPDAPPDNDLETKRVLEHAFKRYSLDLAGPPSRLDLSIAERAADVTRRACWLTLSNVEDEDEIKHIMRFEGTPQNAAQHLSADLCLRFLPRIHNRLRAAKPDDAVVGIIENILKRWPLSGILCDIAAPPVAINLHNEAVMQLYAQRFLQHPKDNWKPTDKALEHIELENFYSR